MLLARIVGPALGTVRNLSRRQGDVLIAVDDFRPTLHVFVQTLTSFLRNGRRHSGKLHLKVCILQLLRAEFLQFLSLVRAHVNKVLLRHVIDLVPVHMLVLEAMLFIAYCFLELIRKA